MRLKSSAAAGGQSRDRSRRDTLLEAAKTVFLRDGIGGFSSRGVAKQAKVRLSTVQHFFSTKEELLVSMIRYVDGQHVQIYQQRESSLPFTPVERLRAVLDYLLQDLFRADTCRFYFDVWALGIRDEKIGRFLDQAYGQHRDALAVLVGAVRPTLSEERCKDLATHIAAMIEGLMLFIAPHGRRFPRRAEFMERAMQTIWTVVTSAPDAEAPARPRGRRRK